MISIIIVTKTIIITITTAITIIFIIIIMKLWQTLIKSYLIMNFNIYNFIRLIFILEK
jgi:hypothetical protein